MTANVFSDYMLGRLDSFEPQKVQREIAANLEAENALRRRRNSTKELRGKLGNIDQVPSERIELLKRTNPNESPQRLRKIEPSRERSTTWL